jgi:hypothetical protein
MPFLTPRLTRFLTRMLDSYRRFSEAGSRADAAADVHVHTLPIHDQTTDPIDHEHD